MTSMYNVQQTTIPGDQITSHVTDCQPVTHGQRNTVGRRSQNTHAHTPPPALHWSLFCWWRASDRRTIMGNVTQSKRERSDILTPLSFSTDLSVLDWKTHTYKTYFDCFTSRLCFMTRWYSQILYYRRCHFIQYSYFYSKFK